MAPACARLKGRTPQARPLGRAQEKGKLACPLLGLGGGRKKNHGPRATWLEFCAYSAFHNNPPWLGESKTTSNHPPWWGTTDHQISNPPGCVQDGPESTPRVAWRHGPPGQPPGRQPSPPTVSPPPPRRVRRRPQSTPPGGLPRLRAKPTPPATPKTRPIQPPPGRADSKGGWIITECRVG